MGGGKPLAHVQLVELGHQQRRCGIRHRPQRAEHARGAERHERAGQADELVGVAGDVVEPGLAGREHHQARAAKPVRLEQPADAQRRSAVHDQRGLARVRPREGAVRGEVPVRLALEGGEHGIGRRRARSSTVRAPRGEVRGDDLAFLLGAGQVAGRVDDGGERRGPGLADARRARPRAPRGSARRRSRSRRRGAAC